MYFRAGKKLAGEVSINETIDIDKEGNPLTYIDVLGSEENMAEEVERAICSERALRLVENLLTAREKKIISMRYGLFGEEAITQREVAEKLGISRSYVSRIEKSALLRLREALGE